MEKAKAAVIDMIKEIKSETDLICIYTFVAELINSQGSREEAAETVRKPRETAEI